jgi:hypothetical protein
MPERLAGVTGGLAEVHAGGELADAAGDFDQPQPHRLQAQGLWASGYELTAQRVEQPVGGPMQQQAHLVGEEAMAGEAVGVPGVEGVGHERHGQLLRAGIGDQTDGVGDARLLAEGRDLRLGKARIGARLDGDRGPPRS